MTSMAHKALKILERGDLDVTARALGISAPEKFTNRVDLEFAILRTKKQTELREMIALNITRVLQEEATR